MNEKGFTAVEMVITLFVAAAAFVLITTIFSSATRLTDRSDDLLLANSIAYQKLQLYENRAFVDIHPTGILTYPSEENFTSELPASLPGPKEGKAYFSLTSPTLKYIFIRIKYQTPNGERNLEYGSLVQATGLGR